MTIIFFHREQFARGYFRYPSKMRLAQGRLGKFGLVNWRLWQSAEARRLASSAVCTPSQRYDQLVQDGKLRNDPYQRKIIKSLDKLHNHLEKYSPQKVSPASALDQLGWRDRFSFGRFFKKSSKPVYNEIPQGIYLYGDVGCGKTMLMDLFYLTIPASLTKKRLHFHQFMQFVHKRSHDIIREQNLDVLGLEKHTDVDPIPFLATEIANSSRILCFDEFQVTDVADAMMLRRLLTALLAKPYGVVLVTTSNRSPDDLYINGIQRELFLPCIQMLKERTDVIDLDSATDYRKIPRPVSSVYYYPAEGMKYNSPECQDARAQHVALWYDYFAQPESEDKKHLESKTHKKLTDYKLRVWGRDLNVPACTPPRVAQFTFKQLCGEPLAAGDYLALASTFRAFVITDIPFLSIYVRDQIRRFITFLDAVYDSGGKLATTGAADFTSLFTEPEDILNDYELKPKHDSAGAGSASDDSDASDDLVTKHGFSKEIAQKSHIFALDEERFAFARALSRLSHMSSQDWVEKPGGK
ncbi:LAMI_0D11452g1_1 [Lachancea mirantina]|uniref:LAMI_0D11452g1_1 n=1 Tax=Lachancea mirantina TaxID=1230905 RepID=A0A1G4JFJ5_9SACH|nr:LAMI_0D11452g1_1 [Lachancea mirantina]